MSDTGIPSEENVGEPTLVVEPAPEQTDNRPRDEDGEQNVDQSPDPVEE